MNIKTIIEVQRARLDFLAGQTDDLTQLLDEAQKMDRLIEIYEVRQSAQRKRKDA